MGILQAGKMSGTQFLYQLNLELNLEKKRGGDFQVCGPLFGEDSLEPMTAPRWMTAASSQQISFFPMEKSNWYKSKTN